MRRILLICLLLASFGARSQQVYEISFQNQRADLAVKRLEEQFGLKFSFDPTLLEEYYITAEIRAKSEDQLLREFVSSLPVRYKRAGDVVLLIPNRKKQAKRTTKSIRGKIYDRNTGQPLARANVHTQKLRTKTDHAGGFSVRPHRDSIEISVTYLGYEPNTMWVKTDLESVSIHLTPTKLELKPFILNPRARDNSQNSSTSHFSVNPNQIRSLPTLGQPDVFKSLQLLPGLLGTDESATGLIVRGSSSEQNLVTLDGFTIYHLDHFFGLFSTFNPHIINHIDLYKGGFSSEYGNRTSSVIAATSKSSNMERVKGGVGLNTTSLDAFLEVPIAKKVGILLGGRWSHDGLVTNRIYNQFLEDHRQDILKASDPEFNDDFDIQSSFSFFDINGKIRFAPSPKTTIDVSAFISEDYFEGDHQLVEREVFQDYLDKAFWANTGGSIRWENHWNDQHTSTLGFSGSSYENQSEIALLTEYTEDIRDPFGDLVVEAGDETFFSLKKRNTIEDVTLSYKSAIDLHPNHRLTIGADVSSYETTISTTFDDEEVEIDSLYDQSSLISLFNSYHFAHKKWQFNVGLRLNNYEILNRTDLEPRISAKYHLLESLSASASWSRHHQYINRQTLSPFGNSDQYSWVLTNDEEYPVLASTHTILGLTWQKGALTVDLEAFHKRTDGIVEAEFTLFSDFNGLDFSEVEDFPAGSQVSRGIDLFARYKSTQVSSWIGYSFGDAIYEFEHPNLPESYYSPFDQRHEINQVNIYKRGRWEFSSTFVFGSGRPYTPAGDISGQEPVLFDLSRINENRLPAYHRLDLSTKYEHKFKWLTAEAGITFFNIYDRRNLKSRRFTGRSDYNEELEEWDFQLIAIDQELLGFTPNFFLNLRF